MWSVTALTEPKIALENDFLVDHYVLQTAACTHHHLQTRYSGDFIAMCHMVPLRTCDILVLDCSVNSDWNTSGQLSINAAVTCILLCAQHLLDPKHPERVDECRTVAETAPRSVALCQHLTQHTAGALHTVPMRARGQMRFCCLYHFRGRQ